MVSSDTKEICILGLTQAGKTFRPSDWAERLAGVMAALHPEEWGQSRHRHFFTGHIHHRSAQEVGGVEWESFQTLAAKDAYSTAQGYISNRGMKAIVFHQERGEIARNSVRVT